MATESSQSDRIAWTLYRNPAGLWHWKRGEHGGSSNGHDRLSDCLVDAQANGYEPALHLLRLEPPGMVTRCPCSRRRHLHDAAIPQTVRAGK
jgi:hypothetical protein